MHKGKIGWYDILLNDQSGPVPRGEKQEEWMDKTNN